MYLQIYAPPSSTETKLSLEKDLIPHTYYKSAVGTWGFSGTCLLYTAPPPFPLFCTSKWKAEWRPGNANTSGIEPQRLTPRMPKVRCLFATRHPMINATSLSPLLPTRESHKKLWTIPSQGILANSKGTLYYCET